MHTPYVSGISYFHDKSLEPRAMETIKWHETAALACAVQVQGSTTLGEKKNKKVAEETRAICASCVLSGEYQDEDNGDIVRYAGEGRNRDQTDTRGEHLTL